MSRPTCDECARTRGHDPRCSDYRTPLPTREADPWSAFLVPAVDRAMTDDDIRALVDETLREEGLIQPYPSWAHCEDCGSRDCRGECKP